MSKYNHSEFFDGDIVEYINGAEVSYGSTVPTTGYYKKGSIIKNVDPSNGIDSWRCISTGSFGAFSQAGTYTTGSAVISGITTTGLNVNDFVNVNTGWAVLTGMRVMEITANSITLDTAANGVGGAVTVSRADPVFAPLYMVYGTPSVGNTIKWNSGGYAEWSI